MSALLLVFALLAPLAFTLWRRNPLKRGLPGPPQIPIIGNILPQDQPWEAIRQYAAKYGPVFELRVLSTRFAFVNTYAAARELFETRSSIYSERITMKMAELSGLDGGALFARPKDLRQARRLASSGVSPREVQGFRTQLDANIVQFLGTLLETPDDFMQHIRTLAVGTMLDITYGYRPKGPNDPFAVRAEAWVENFARATSMGDFFVNWFTFLAYIPSWVPGAGFQKTAAAWKKQAEDFAEDAHQFVVKSMASGVAKTSIVSKALESPEPYDKEVLTKSAIQFVTGGADTTVTVSTSFFLAMARNPEVQQRAQAEIDRVIGGDRLPVYADRSNLPYVDAVMKEVFRCYTPVPLVLRSMDKDDVYEGYYIPKDTFVMMSPWSMLHDESLFPDPLTFNPDRWLNNDVSKETNPIEIVFGFGRRECPGKFLAMEMVFNTIAATLATFDIRKPKDSSGRPYTPPEKFSSGSIRMSAPFKCTITPRSPDTLQFLTKKLEEVGA